MFDTGTRVIVLNSSFSGKTGPKKGSIGYALDIKLGEHGSYYDNDRFWFVTLHRVAFVRYGFEDNQRHEAKFFINIFPYVSNRAVAETNMTRLINKKLDAVEKFDPTNQKIYDKIRYTVTSKFGKKHVHTGILVPAPVNTSLIGTSPNDFGAWIECFMKDNRFHQVVMEMINNYGRIGHIVTAEYLMMIKKMIDSKKERLGHLVVAQNTPVMREEIVSTIRKIMAIGDRPRRQAVRKLERKWLSYRDIYDSTRKQLAAMRVVLDHLYSKDATENLKIIQARNKGSEVIERKVKYMTEITAQMVSRARALEDGVEAKLQTVNHE